MKTRDPEDSQKGVDTSKVILIAAVIIGTLLAYYDVIRF
jgi:hypothetical protein